MEKHSSDASIQVFTDSVNEITVSRDLCNAV